MERCLWLGGRSVSAELPALCGKCLGGVGGGACETPRKQHSSVEFIVVMVTLLTVVIVTC